jgi:hypothetical protein
MGFVFSSLALAGWLSPSLAHAQTKAECVAAYKEGQIHRKNGELLAARSSFQVCAATKCSAVLRRDCEPWLAQVTNEIPTLMVKPRGTDGKPVAEPRMFVDRHLPTSRADNGALELDPGAHLLRVEADGYMPAEQAVSVHAGEKNLNFELPLVPLKPEPPPPPPPPPAPPAPPTRPIPTLTLVFGAAGAASLGAFAGFGLVGASAKQDLEACKPACAPDQVDSVKRDYIVADVALGVGAAFIGLAVYTFLARPTVRAAQTTALAVRPSMPVGLTFSW